MKMKKTFYISFLFLIQIFAFGQTSSIVKNIFYNLPLDKQRFDIYETLKSDKRFKSSTKDTNHLNIFSIYSYSGLCQDNGIVKSKADSIEIELSNAIGLSPTKKINKKGKSKTINFTFLEIRYFYPSRDSAEKEYKNLLNILEPVFKDTGFITIDTIYSDSPLRSQFKATGIIFNNHKPKYSVRVLIASITKNYFRLSIEFERDEK